MNWKKWIPLVVILGLMVFAYFLGVTKHLSFETLKSHRKMGLHFVETHPILSPVLFILIYIVVTALSLPGGVILTLIGGFLFGVLFGTLYVILGATCGATVLFLAARTALGDIFKKKARPFISKMEAGFQRGAVWYLLFLRLIPLFPFWLVNIAPAFFQVRLVHYVWTTCVGIIPGTYIYALAGSGLGAIFDEEQAFSIDSIFNTQVKIALFALAIFVLIPIFIKSFLKKQSRHK